LVEHVREAGEPDPRANAVHRLEAAVQEAVNDLPDDEVARSPEGVAARREARAEGRQPGKPPREEIGHEERPRQPRALRDRARSPAVEVHEEALGALVANGELEVLDLVLRPRDEHPGRASEAVLRRGRVVVVVGDVLDRGRDRSGAEPRARDAGHLVAKRGEADLVSAPRELEERGHDREEVSPRGRRITEHPGH